MNTYLAAKQLMSKGFELARVSANNFECSSAVVAKSEHKILISTSTSLLVLYITARTTSIHRLEYHEAVET